MKNAMNHNEIGAIMIANDADHDGLGHWDMYMN